MERRSVVGGRQLAVGVASTKEGHESGDGEVRGRTRAERRESRMQVRKAAV